MAQQFTGQERDKESSLDYFGARYYSARLGRFVSSDAPFADQFASAPQSWSLYGYVRNNPLRFLDLTGRRCVTTDDGSVGDDGEDYVKKAKSFVNNPPIGTLTKIRANGDVVLYNPFSNTFAVRTADGVPRTLFKPDTAKHGYATNLDYFRSQ